MMQADNPVQRIIERRDIWKVAEQARVINLPGSVLEDRQYQLDLLGASISTGQCLGRGDLNRSVPRTG